MIRGEGLLNRNKQPLREHLATSASTSASASCWAASRSRTATPTASSTTATAAPTRRPARQVDGRGCPSDTDSDGVPNGVDRCPTTVSGAAVDATRLRQRLRRRQHPRRPRPLPRHAGGRAGRSARLPPGLRRRRHRGRPRPLLRDAARRHGGRAGLPGRRGWRRRPRRSRPLPPDGRRRPGQSDRLRRGPESQRPRTLPPTGPPPAAAAVPPAVTRERRAAGARGGQAIRENHRRRIARQWDSSRERRGSTPAPTSRWTRWCRSWWPIPRSGSRSWPTRTTAGTPTANLHLTSLQADAVRNYLVTKGVSFPAGRRPRSSARPSHSLPTPLRADALQIVAWR